MSIMNIQQHIEEFINEFIRLKREYAPLFLEIFLYRLVTHTQEGRKQYEEIIHNNRVWQFRDLVLSRTDVIVGLEVEASYLYNASRYTSAGNGAIHVQRTTIQFPDLNGTYEELLKKYTNLKEEAFEKHRKDIEDEERKTKLQRISELKQELASIEATL